MVLVIGRLYSKPLVYRSPLIFITVKLLINYGSELWEVFIGPFARIA